MGILAGGSAGVPEQASSQDGDLLGQLVEAVGLGVGLVRRRWHGALELPGELDGPVDQEAFDVVGGLEVGGPAIEPGVEGVGIFAGEDEGPGPHTMLECVQRHVLSLLARASGFCALHRFASARFDDVSASFMAVRLFAGGMGMLSVAGR